MCRFYPSCSTYAHEAIRKHGLVAGSILAAVRLVKCQPLHPGGIDEVPDQLFGNAKISIASKARHKWRQCKLPERTFNRSRAQRSVLTCGGAEGTAGTGALT